MKQIGQLNEEDLKAYNNGDRSVIKKYLVRENHDLRQKLDSLYKKLDSMLPDEKSTDEKSLDNMNNLWKEMNRLVAKKQMEWNLSYKNELG